MPIDPRKKIKEFIDWLACSVSITRILACVFSGASKQEPVRHCGFGRNLFFKRCRMSIGPMGWTPDWVQEALLKHITGMATFSAPANHWLALGTSPPAETARTSWTNELSGNGYQRKAIDFSAPKTTYVSGSSGNLVSTIRNKCPVIFDQATSNWSGFKYFAIFSAQTGGDLLYWAEYTAVVEGAPAIVVKKAHRLELQPCEIEVHLVKNQTTYGPVTAVCWSKYLQENVLNLLFRGVGFTPPTNYLCLVYTKPSPLDSGADLDEPSPSVGYGRTVLDDWDAPTVNSVELADIVHTPTVSFPEATGDWSVPTFLAVVDADTDGNLLYFQDSSPPAGPIEAGDVATVTAVRVLTS
jgi:hypothetical protein